MHGALSVCTVYPGDIVDNNRASSGYTKILSISPDLTGDVSFSFLRIVSPEIPN